MAAHAEGSRFNLQYSKRKEIRERGKEEGGRRGGEGTKGWSHGALF